MLIQRFALILLATVSTVTAAFADPVVVRTTTKMLQDPLQHVLGEEFEVVAMLGAGTDPHTYQPTRKDIRDLAKADVVVFHGLNFEAQLLGLMDQLKRRVVVIDVSKGQKPEDLLFEQNVPDPHSWNDLLLWNRTIELAAQEIRSAAKSTSVSEETEFSAALIALDAWIAEQFLAVPEADRIIVSAHDAFQYFGRRYGIEFAPLQGLSTASEIKLSRLNDLVDLIVERGITAVFDESSVESGGLAALREGVASRGIELRSMPPLYSDALGAEGTPAGTYLGMLVENTVNMVDAMTGERPFLPEELKAQLLALGVVLSEESNP